MMREAKTQCALNIDLENVRRYGCLFEWRYVVASVTITDAAAFFLW